jgi:putative LysE/RhtB family amino acid efflux pump
MRSVLVGFGLGLLVAMQLGPMSLFLIRSTLRAGWRVGLAIGGGIALVDGSYAALGAAGAAPLVAIGPVRAMLGLAGAAFLAVVGLRTLRSALRVRLGVESEAEMTTAAYAFRASVAGTASNPATIASWAAIFAGASSAGAAAGTSAAALLVLGAAAGSLAWVSVLACGVALLRRGLNERALRIADAVAGVGMLGFGGALAYSATREH